MFKYTKITLSQTNCFLLKAKEGYLLIDCGNKGDAYTLIKAIHNEGITLKDIHYLLLTHHHNDHCGLLAFLVNENPNIKVIMSSDCAQYLKAGVHYKDENEKYSSPLLRLFLGLYFRFKGKQTDKFEPYNARVNDLIINNDDDAILAGLGINGKVLLTPGHTADSISVIADDTAFVGDAVRNMLNFAGAPYKPLLISNSEDCKTSIKKIVDSGATMICPAHGKSFSVDKLKNLKL